MRSSQAAPPSPSPPNPPRSGEPLWLLGTVDNVGVVWQSWQAAHLQTSQSGASGRPAAPPPHSDPLHSFRFCESVTLSCYSSLFLFPIQCLWTAICCCFFVFFSMIFVSLCACVRLCARAHSTRALPFAWLTPGRLRHQAPARCAKLAILLRG